jgi:DNA replication initiation complex subunit (GINS family)
MWIGYDLSNEHSKVPNIIIYIGVAMTKQDEEFTFETIAKVYREERKQTTLTKLPIHFYSNLKDYIERLHQGYLAARKEDPNSPKAVMLEDEFGRSQKRANQIYEYRERKITTLALSVANGGNPNVSPLTAEEKIALEGMVETLMKNRSKILLTNEENSCEPATFLTNEEKVIPTEKEYEIDEEKISHAQKELTENENDETQESKPHEENPVILVLEDIPSFSTEERALNLKKDDVISLPKRYANILCKNEKARMILRNK